MTSVSKVGQSTFRGRLRAGFSCWLLCLELLVPAIASAQPVEIAARTAAREFATKGAEAFERGAFAEALEYLKRANTLHPAPSISVLEARALVHLGRFLEALDRYEQTMRAPLPDDAPEAYRAATRDAAVESEQLKSRIPHLSIQVQSVGATPQDVVVLLDGKSLPIALLNVDFPADPGDHEVVVRAPKFDMVTRNVHLAERERVVLEIAMDLPALTAPVAVSPSAVALEADAAPPRVSSLRPFWGWATVGGGAAALLTAAVTGKIALDSKSHLDSVCRPGCPEGNENEIGNFRTFRTVSYVAGGVSIALMGLGGYLLLHDPVDDRSVSVGVEGSGIQLRGKF
jgi:hypothetical protein